MCTHVKFYSVQMIYSDLHSETAVTTDAITCTICGEIKRYLLCSYLILHEKYQLYYIIIFNIGTHDFRRGELS